MRYVRLLSGASSKLWYSRPICRHLHHGEQRKADPNVAPVRLDLQAIDRKWQKRWQHAAQSVQQREGSPKAYVLSMFPYPSGNLHIGHLRVYTIADVLARYKRMQGYDVLSPMGWDAFGLPAENAALERGVDPETWTKSNVERMKSQIIAMNGGFDWDREFMTCDPSFYKHTQHIFLLLHERGLAYQAESLVNFDPIDKTVLANEQVDANGFSWRSGAKVEKLKLKQWFLRVTDFKEALLNDLDRLGFEHGWPERVLAMQRNWVGKSEGATLRFPLSKEEDFAELDHVKVFTTRPDTLVGVQYLALSLSHPVVSSSAATCPELQRFLDQASTLPEDSKAGYQLPDIYAQNPLSVLDGSPECVYEPLPVYAAPYVLEEYGEGAVMGVPGHDVRDNDFWKQHQSASAIREVIRPTDISTSSEDGNAQVVFTKPGVLTEICGNLAELTSQEASKKIISLLSAVGDLAEPTENWKLRDWLISRQRYWGTPIPIVHCNDCGVVPVSAEDLPVELPKLAGNWFLKKGGNPLESTEDWVNTACPSCGGPAKRDTDTMDTFVDSSWYFMRFIDPHNALQPFSPDKADAILPVDIYVGGIEHAILHLLYARFMSKFLATTPLWPSGGGKENNAEPFSRLITQGMVHGKTYSDPLNGRFLKPEEVDISDPSLPKMFATGETPVVSWEKMSKSKYNGVDPTKCIDTYGADVMRAHLLFQAPVGQVLEWEEERIVGIQRWFSKIWRIVEDLSPQDPSCAVPALPFPSILTDVEKQLYLILQNTIASVSHSLSTTFALNTVISDLIKLANALAASPTASQAVRHNATSALLCMLAPVAPAFTEECWERLHLHFPLPNTDKGASIFMQPFPTATTGDGSIQPNTQTCVVQENGKLRFAITVPKAPEEVLGKGNETELREWVVAEIGKSKDGERWLHQKNKDGKIWSRVVVVKGGKTVNFVG